MIGGRHRRAWRWLFAIGAFVLAVAALALVIPNVDRRGVASKGAGGPGETYGDDPARRESGALGTAGDSAGDANEATGDAIISELATITGANDAMQLVGRRVDLHVDVRERANDVAFWVGEGDNRLLVVLVRDTRTGPERQAGVPPRHGIVPVATGQQATISGVIRPLPRAEAMESWNLTRADLREAAERKVYLRADSVSPDGHGRP